MPFGLIDVVSPAVKTMASNEKSVGCRFEMGLDVFAEFFHVLVIFYDWKSNFRLMGVDSREAFEHFPSSNG